MLIGIVLALFLGITIVTITGFRISKPRRKIKNNSFTDSIPYEIYKEL